MYNKNFKSSSVKACSGFAGFRKVLSSRHIKRNVASQLNISVSSAYSTISLHNNKLLVILIEKFEQVSHLDLLSALVIQVAEYHNYGLLFSLPECYHFTSTVYHRRKLSISIESVCRPFNNIQRKPYKVIQTQREIWLAVLLFFTTRILYSL